jgi:hypothetical protein
MGVNPSIKRTGRSGGILTGFLYRTGAAFKTLFGVCSRPA